MELKLGDSEYELKLFERFKELVQAGGMQLQSGESTSKPGIYNLLNYYNTEHKNSVLSTDKSEGMSGGRGLGGVCGNIKVLSSTLFSHQSCIRVEGLQSRHALCMLGRTLTSQE